MRPLTWALAGSLALASCSRTVYVPVESRSVEVRSDVRASVDTVFLHDSVEVVRAADTLRITRWRDRWHRSLLRDSIYLTRTDTIRVPVPVSSPSSNKLTWADKLRRRLFVPLLLACAALAAFIRFGRRY